MAGMCCQARAGLWVELSHIMAAHSDVQLQAARVVQQAPHDQTVRHAEVVLLHRVPARSSKTVVQLLRRCCNNIMFATVDASHARAAQEHATSAASFHHK